MSRIEWVLAVIGSTVFVTSPALIVRAAYGWSTEANTNEQSSAVQAANRCGDREHRMFDFMIGRWKTSEPGADGGTSLNGNSEIESVVGGCALIEHRHVFKDDKPAYEATLVWGHDEGSKEWLLFTVDDHSHVELYNGRREGNGWTFYGERLGRDGKLVSYRVTFLPEAAGFAQRLESSKNNGKTWQAASVLSFRPDR